MNSLMGYVGLANRLDVHMNSLMGYVEWANWWALYDVCELTNAEVVIGVVCSMTCPENGYNDCI